MISQCIFRTGSPSRLAASDTFNNPRTLRLSSAVTTKGSSESMLLRYSSVDAAFFVAGFTDVLKRGERSLFVKIGDDDWALRSWQMVERAREWLLEDEQ